MNVTAIEPRPGRERGQAIVLFALLLVLIIGAAGMLMDGGMAWANRRAAQAAADFAALAAAQAIADAGLPCNSSGLAIGQAAADKVAEMNGFPRVLVEYPAASGSFTGCAYVRVQVSRSMSTTFSRVYGETEWEPTADATVNMERTVKSVASCTFCSLNKSSGNHTLLIQLGTNGAPSTLIVDGDIVVNSSNGKTPKDPSSGGKWVVFGDAFDIFSCGNCPGGRIQAKHISVVGGWETHDNGIAVADEATCPLDQRPTPPQYLLLTPPIEQSNICIHQPVLADPLLGFPVPVYSDYVVQQTKKFEPVTSVTIDPGIYIGGIFVDKPNVTVTMRPGVYYLAGGGLTVSGTGSLIGEGVTIYNGSAPGKTGKAGAIKIDKGTGTIVLTPSESGQFGGMTIMQERASNVGITLNPSNPQQCASTAASGEPQGCLGGIAGTIYSPNESSTVTIFATGTANLQIIAGKLLVKNGGTARFTYKAKGFASTSTVITLVE